MATDDPRAARDCRAGRHTRRSGADHADGRSDLAARRGAAPDRLDLSDRGVLTRRTVHERTAVRRGASSGEAGPALRAARPTDALRRGLSGVGLLLDLQRRIPDRW